MSSEPTRNSEVSLSQPSRGATDGQAPTKPRFLGRPKPWALVLWTAVAAVVIYSSTWVGPVSFYLTFQRMVAGKGAPGESGDGPLAWATPVASAAPAPAAGYRVLGGLLVPLPPGTPSDVDWGETEATATYPEGRVRYDLLPERFVLDLYAQQIEALGRRGRERLDEAVLFRRILETVPAEFRFGWDDETRTEYAARMLAKLRLLRDLPVRRLELAERDEPRASAALVEFASGEATVLVVAPEGGVAIQLPEKAPSSWKASAALWLPREHAAAAPSTTETDVQSR